jgi:acyl carrier protein
VPGSVQVVNLAGEPLAPALVDQIYAETSAQKVYDLYGPTETTTYSTFALRVAGEPPTIGRPLANEQIYLLDAQLQPVPIGVPGGLYIGGAGLARGYLNREEMTRECFVPHPFKAGARLYKTGDLARWRADGNLVYLGRSDHQVKLRGFRIELGEIESALRNHPDIVDAVVLAREDKPGEKRLAAYIVNSPQKQVTTAQLRGAVREKLPEYMVPSAFVFLDALPLTPNGKVDRKALPIPEQGRESSRAFVAPRTPLEVQLAGIWGEVLQIDRVGATDNFFELGGHSLLAIQAIARIADTLNIQLPLSCLFEAPTIADLFRHWNQPRATANCKPRSFRSNCGFSTNWIPPATPITCRRQSGSKDGWTWRPFKEQSNILLCATRRFAPPSIPPRAAFARRLSRHGRSKSRSPTLAPKRNWMNS